MKNYLIPILLFICGCSANYHSRIEGVYSVLERATGGSCSHLPSDGEDTFSIIDYGNGSAEVQISGFDRCVGRFEGDTLIVPCVLNRYGIEETLQMSLQFNNGGFIGVGTLIGSCNINMELIGRKL